MSWNAYIGDRDWNYTHNCNGMVNDVIEKLALDVTRTEAWWGDGISWWKHLDGMTGAEGYNFFKVIVGALIEAPEHFKAMNPKNGWGDYDSFLAVLVEMQNASRRYAFDKWVVHG